MRKISASELGSFLYCQRSRWYAQQVEKSANKSEMDLGSQVHYSHARTVKQSQLYQWLGVALLMGGMSVLVWRLFS
jgi:hypothetical protein